MNALNITSLRKSLGMNQKEFGDKIGIAQSYLSEIERGKKPLYYNNTTHNIQSYKSINYKTIINTK